MKRERIQRIKKEKRERGENVDENEIAENLPEQEVGTFMDLQFFSGFLLSFHLKEGMEKLRNPDDGHAFFHIFLILYSCIIHHMAYSLLSFLNSEGENLL